MSATQMNKQRKIMIGIFLAVMLLAPGIATAFGGPQHHGRGQGMKGDGGFGCGLWRNPALVQELGLSDDQVSRIKELDYAGKEKHLKIKSQIRELQLQLDKALTAKTVDKSAVRSLTKKLSDLRGDRHMQRIESRLAMKEILTAEQAQKLDAYRMEHRGKGQGRGFGKKHGHGYGRGDCPRGQAY